MTTWTWIGLWRREGRPDRPDPADLADPSWDVDERSLVATYLEGGLGIQDVLIRSSPASVETFCLLCGGDSFMPFVRTDGTYVWPVGLVHYVEMHSVRLPSQLVDYILHQQPFDFDAIRTRAQDRITAPEGFLGWQQGQHDESWWRQVTSQVH